MHTQDYQIIGYDGGGGFKVNYENLLVSGTKNASGNIILGYMLTLTAYFDQGGNGGDNQMMEDDILCDAL